MPIEYRHREYLPGREMDVHGASGPAVLLWHGRGSNARGVLAGLATAIAAAGVRVYVPDWSSERSDDGRSELLASLQWARSLAGDDLVLGGWSLGGRAAIAVGLAPELTPGWRPRHVIGLAARPTGADPMGVEPADRLDTEPGPRFTLVYGTLDPNVDAAQGRSFAQQLAQRGHRVQAHETPTDHSGVALAEYDEIKGRSAPATSPDRLAAGQVSVDAIVDAVLEGYR